MPRPPSTGSEALKPLSRISLITCDAVVRHVGEGAVSRLAAAACNKQAEARMRSAIVSSTRSMSLSVTS